MKQAIALVGAVAMLAYLFAQAMLLVLQPIFAAFSNHPRLGEFMNPKRRKEVKVKKEDVLNLLFLVAALAYFAGHVVWAKVRSLR